MVPPVRSPTSIAFVACWRLLTQTPLTQTRYSNLDKLRAMHPDASSKAGEREPRNIVGGRTGDGEVGQDFTDHRGELETVPGARRRHDDRLVARHPVEDEIAVGCHSVEASGGGEAPAIGGGQMGGEHRADH